MTAKTDGAAGRSGARATGRGAAPAAMVEQRRRTDRADRGKLPEHQRRWSPMASAGRVVREIRSGCCWATRSRECRSWRRSGTGRCWCPPFMFYWGRHCRWRLTWAARPHLGCGCSCAGTRTCPISGRPPRRNGVLSSKSTTSTRPSPGRSSGMSSGWSRAFTWPGGTTGLRLKAAARSSWRRPRATAPRCGVRAAALPRGLVRASGHRGGHQAVPVPGEGEQVQGHRSAAGQSINPRRHADAGKADHHD
jgi:hypothetical protein